MQYFRLKFNPKKASASSCDDRPNTFEFFGADFMLTEDLKVILLEINRSPDPSNNTRYQRELFDNLGIEFQPVSRNFDPINSRIS